MKEYSKNEFFDNPDEMIHVSKQVNLEKPNPVHSHEFVSLTYFLDGNAVYMINDHEFKIKKGNLMLLNAGQAHSFIPEGHMSYINVFIRNEFMQSSILNSDNSLDLFLISSLFDEFEDTESDFPIVSFSNTEMLKIENLFNFMLDEFVNKDTAYNAMLEGCTKLLLSMVLRNLRNAKNKEWVTNVKNIMPDVIEYVNKNYSKNITLKDLVKDNFYNPAYFNKVFKDCYGLSVKEYVIKKRIDKAVNLLNETDMPIEKIAVEVGYENKTHFYRLFKKIIGVTPAEFRKGT